MARPDTRVVDTSVSDRADSARRRLADLFLARSVEALRRLSATAPTEVLEAALRAPTDVGGVASFISDVAPLAADRDDLDPWAAELAEGAELKLELLEAAGGVLSAGEVGRLLGNISRQAVDQRARRNRLLAVPLGNGRRGFPACQFTGDGVVPGLEEVLAAFRVEDPWMRLSVLLDEDPSLGEGRTVIEALRAGEREKVLRIVRSFWA